MKNFKFAGLYWRRIRISDGANKKTIKRAKKLANDHPPGELRGLDFTEKNFEWVLLYDHIRLGQITPQVMRSMRRQDLYYLAGLTFPHPALAQPKDNNQYTDGFMGAFFDQMAQESAAKRWEVLTKIQGNAIRATEEIRRRNFWWSSFYIVVAALVGAMIGGALKG